MKKINLLVIAALFAALTCITTMAMPIHLPSNFGYIHPGDGFVIMSGIILGPIYGPLAAGIGSFLADLILGYAAYAPITFIIKFLAAFAASIIYRNSYKLSSILSVILSGIFAGIIVTSGYFTFDYLTIGYPTAIANVTPNLVQNTFGVIISSVLFPVLKKIPQIRETLQFTQYSK